MIPAETLLDAYREGIFPMADESGEISWYEADPRTILEVQTFHPPRDLRRILNRRCFEVYFDRSFERVMRACAQREYTWISEEIIQSYINLHRLGFAHSVESWQNGKLVGGLYGVALHGAFFGESMFFRVSHASKVALANLAEHLKKRGYVLHDAQMMTSTLKLFGATEISREEYLARLHLALRKKVSFY